MMTSAKVSVLLTSYNHAKYLRESIESVLNQTYKNFELIIWDDASTDDSWNIISSYTDSRIRAFSNETNQFIEYIRKAISDVAKGEYIAIHHSDDVWEVDKLEKQVAFLDAHSEIGAVFTWAQIIDDHGDNLDEDWFIQENKSRWQWLQQFFQGENHLNHPSVLIRKICYQEVGLYAFGLAQTPDADMWMRLLLKYPIHVIQERLTKHRLVLDKSNTSGNRPDTRVRLQYEFYKLMRNYLKITRFDDLVKIFPSVEKYYRNKETDIHFALAMALLEESTSSFAQLFGLDILFEIISDPISSANIKQLYEFDYQAFIALTGKYDVFSHNAVYERDGQVATLIQTISALNQAVAERDGQIASLNQAVARLEQDMVERARQAFNLNQALAERDQQLASVTAQLNEIFRSKAWYFIQMYRKIRSRIIGP